MLLKGAQPGTVTVTTRKEIVSEVQVWARDPSRPMEVGGTVPSVLVGLGS